MARKTSHNKLVLLGDTAVGKSCLVVRFVRDEFFDFQEPTIGAAFLTQTITLDDVTVKFEIWDTAGQERYRSLAPMYYRGAVAAVVVYDITSEQSFVGAKGWVSELKRRGDQNVVIGECWVGVRGGVGFPIVRATRGVATDACAYNFHARGGAQR